MTERRDEARDGPQRKSGTNKEMCLVFSFQKRSCMLTCLDLNSLPPPFICQTLRFLSSLSFLFAKPGEAGWTEKKEMQKNIQIRSVCVEVAMCCI
jgi:hypothetical protein